MHGDPTFAPATVAPTTDSVRVMIGFLVQHRVRIKIRIRVRLYLTLAFTIGAIVAGANVHSDAHCVPPLPS